ncbi:ATP-dependent DNA helicase RecG [Lutispora saccharofermentans]|uniref:ATP-dependent DNA helicase RecG n=1 Tax=Lutispora saccharofermentans TaxID=3024236 RepID=A0ABT1N9X3_9FIRM|nr:ATP-dependent DNA helicase RecG [Lutispora saccharofermentans]MCQ1528050.1 ATP-dependent DNA helicase RecG [Lutispora saccharofermentans]
MDVLNESVQVLKGIGSSKARMLSRLGINMIQDLIYYFPKGYKDKSIITRIKDAAPGGYFNVTGIVESRASESRSKRGLLITRFIVSDGTGSLAIVFYNNRFAKNMFKQGDKAVFSGRTSLINNMVSMECPEYEKSVGNNINTLRIVPEYGLTEGLSQKEIRKAVYGALELVDNKMEEVFPAEFRKRFKLSEINFSIRNIHFPDSLKSLEMAQRRLKFQEVFFFQSYLLRMRNRTAIGEEGIEFKAKEDAKAFESKLPYSLTSAQSRVLEEVLADMGKPSAMNRLIQGDVGSGKTVIAFLALLNCVKSGYQGVLMAPTEILAVQHFETIRDYISPGGENIKIELITGSMRSACKKEVLENIKEGKIDIIIGTHAVLSEGVDFNKLGLVITDEQHRFGVRQRAILQSKGSNPDMLVMSATPIPRTLSLVLYGDLDISVIDELPPNRKKIETYFISSDKRDRLYNFVKKLIGEGRQAYIVCPLVEESEKLELNSAKEYCENIKNSYFKEYNIGLVYGKMKNEEKDRAMLSFKNGKTQIIVSTTVIEVGINVPNATIMLIENAERFGLAQLHQLRGRVGRGEHQSYCILISDSNSEAVRDRLSFMTKTNDGFLIAKKDLETRGSGEILGTRQHGLEEFRLVDLSKDYDIIKASKEAIEYLYKDNGIKEAIYHKLVKYLNDEFDKIIEKIALN